MRKGVTFDVRPIPSRLLKSLVDTVRFQLDAATILDLFAGKGTIGTALLMAGATNGVFVEKDTTLCKEIRESLLKHRLKGEVVCESVERYFGKEGEDPRQFDLVVADPPFPLWDDAEFTNHFPLQAARRVRRGGLLILKVPSRWLPPPVICDLKRGKSSVVGDSQVVYYESDSKD